MTVGAVGATIIELLLVGGARVDQKDHLGRLIAAPGGSVTWRGWKAEDGVRHVVYTTSSVVGGPLHGKFFVQVFLDRFAAHGLDRRYEVVYERTFSRRNLAKARALQLYADHSPKWAVRNGY